MYTKQCLEASEDVMLLLMVFWCVVVNVAAAACPHHDTLLLYVLQWGRFDFCNGEGTVTCSTVEYE